MYDLPVDMRTDRVGDRHILVEKKVQGAPRATDLPHLRAAPPPDGRLTQRGQRHRRSFPEKSGLRRLSGLGAVADAPRGVQQPDRPMHQGDAAGDAQRQSGML